MFRKIHQYADKHHMFKEGDRILIGLSGGADSVCLARYLLTLRGPLSVRLHALHVNHMLRGGESEADQSFVEEFCGQNDIPLTVVRENVTDYAKKRKLSLEEAGREIRYHHFHRLADQKACDRIALAHHLGDQAETILFRMARGTGIRGLKGMEPVRGRIVRPLLSVKREEILAVLSGLSQDYREDSSNALTDYHRNRIRHRILPEMTGINAGALEHMAGLSDRVRELEDYLKPLIEEACDHYMAGNRQDSRPPEILIREDLSKEPAFLRHEVLREAMARAAGKKKDISRVHVDSLEELLFNRPGKMISLPYHMKARKLPSGLMVCREEEGGRDAASGDGPEKTLCIPLPPAGREPALIREQGLAIRICIMAKEPLSGLKKEERHCRVLLDCDRINTDLCVRTRKPGDYFIMDSRGHRKLLKRYYIDQKIPSEQRETRLVLAADSHVLWTEDGRISHPFQCSETTRNILCIEIRKET